MRFEDINWNEMWKQVREDSSLNKLRGLDMSEFWNKRAKRYNESIKYNDRSDRIISKLDIDSHSTVLDIGAGPGTLAISLAKRAKSVTAVEPSIGMLECLKQNAVNEGLTNINYINKKWEEAEVEQHDIVIASYSLAMEDIQEALSRMNDAAKKYVYLFTFASRIFWDYDKLYPKLYGEEYKPGPDYIYLYNLLYSMGIYANVNITQFEYKQPFSSLDDAVNYYKNNFNMTSSEKDDFLRSYLAKRLEEKDGELWAKHESKSAMIWWEKCSIV